MTRFALSLAAAVAALAVPAPALAADWTAPATISTDTSADPTAVGGAGGGVLTGFLSPTASRAPRSGDGFGALAPITAADPFERVWHAGEADDGTAIVLNVRKHKPTQRVRAIFVGPDGTRSATRTISDFHHSAAQPQLSVAPDGTAVAAWQWHLPTGWALQAAIRRPGQPRFDKPQTISDTGPNAKLRPWIHVAAGAGGRGAVTWQYQGEGEQPLKIETAGTDGVFGAQQTLPSSGSFADVGLAVSATGEVQVAWLDEHFGTSVSPSSLHVAQGTVGSPLGNAAVLSTGGKGISSGPQVAAAFSGDGSAFVAWAKPGNSYEDGGALEVFTRAAGGSFTPGVTLTPAGAQGVVAAGGPGEAGVISWMIVTKGQPQDRYSVHASTRPQAGGAFGADQTISDTTKNALWPSVAMTPAADAIDTWVVNTSGGGDGQPAAAIHRDQ